MGCVWMASSEFGADFYLIIVLIIIQLAGLGLLIYLYYKKRQSAFLTLIGSVTIFILSNILTLVFIHQSEKLWLEFFQGMLSAAGLAPIVVFLEIFENGTPFNRRSSTSIIFILLVGTIKAAKYAYPPRVGDFISLMAPILFIIIGGFYTNTIKKMRERIRFENQKSKIRKIRVGVYLTFIVPKFIVGLLMALTVSPVLIRAIFENITIFDNYNSAILQEEHVVRLFEMILNSIQMIGIALLSIPIIFSNSVFFMQSRKVSKLIVITKDGAPIFEFPFESDANACDEDILNEVFVAISTVMGRGGISCQKLKTMNYGDLEIMTEIRNGFAALLIVDKPTAFLSKSLGDFADDFNDIFPVDKTLNEIRTQKLKFTAEKMIQMNFGLEQEEFEQIKSIVSMGYDKVADEYLATRSEEDEEVKLLPDFMKRLPVGGRVLDAGCGAGEPITRILSEKFKVVGVDISKKQIDIAREMLPYCDFVWQDMTTLTYPDEYFDGIVSYYAIQHIPREEHRGLLINFQRMLKPKGLALLCFATTDEPGTVVDDFFGVKMYWSSFDAGTNVEMLKDAGFEVIWIKLIFDDITEEQHLFVLAQKNNETNN
ncbi:MAG: class I SAM-dependent methyltransferase [Asgard group archaeon]|nr:class I SAM-dependent methyltransferase [Asgard group archaeon]